MSFLSNKNANSLALHNAIFLAAESASGDLFGPIFLYKQGFSLTFLCFLWALWCLLRIFFRLCTFRIPAFIGLKKTVILTTIATGLSVLLLAKVQTFDSWFIAYFLLSSSSSALYWLCYHTYYSTMGDSLHRGKQSAVKQILRDGGSAIMPLLAAILISQFGFSFYFICVAFIIFFSLIPLLFCSDFLIKPIGLQDIKTHFKTLGSRVALGDGIGLFSLTIPWTFILFFESATIVSFGIFTSFALLVSFILHLFLGDRMDRGNGRSLSTLFLFSVFLLFLVRIFIPLSIHTILLVQVIYAFFNILLMTNWSRPVYNEGKVAKSPFAYWIAHEIKFDLGYTMAGFLTSFWLFIGGDLRLAMLLGIVGYFLMWRVLWRYYANLSFKS